jgi:3-oxoacyl-[acyl-carrier-protein] synthase-3
MKISYYLPSKIEDNQTFEALGWPSKKIFAKTGIRQRHISAPNETALDLAVRGCETLFADHSIDRTAIDYILYCTQSPDFIIPGNAGLLQFRLGLSNSIGAVDINQGCTGYVYALSLAKGLLATQQAHSILIITTDTYTKYIHPLDRANRSIFGDGASATLLEQNDVESIGQFIFGTDGSGAQNICVKTSGLKYPKNAQTSIEQTDDSGNVRSDDNLYMNGSEVFSFTLEHVPAAVTAILAKHALTLNDIDHFVFHQANGFILTHLRDKIGIPEEKFSISMENTGNTVSSTIPIVLSDLMRTKTVKENDRVMLVSFGVGYSWAATILTYKIDEDQK